MRKGTSAALSDGQQKAGRQLSLQVQPTGQYAEVSQTHLMHQAAPHCTGALGQLAFIKRSHAALLSVSSSPAGHAQA